MINIFRSHSNPRGVLWVILAHLLVLIAMGLGLVFVFRTTGGTLFLFSAAAPLLILISVGILSWRAIVSLRRRHSIFEYQTISPGEIVYREGDPADCVYFIEKGEVEVSRSHYGQKDGIATLRAGDYFGEMSVLSDRPNRNATVRAITEAKIAALGKENFLRMMFTVPSVRDTILQTAHGRFEAKIGENPNSEG